MTVSSKQAHDRHSSWTESFGRGWNDFWFRPSDPTLVSLIRIGVGLVALLHLCSYAGDLTRWLAADGLLPMETVRALWGEGERYRPTYLTLGGTPAILWTFHALGLIAAAAITLGLFTRVSALLTAVATLALVHRAPML